jgi:predicted phosphoribosyltransferase
MRFRNRERAGRLLATQLQNYQNQAVVYALPRGGVVIGIIISNKLDAPLDLIIPRKVGHPKNPEFAVCAVTESGFLACDRRTAQQLDQSWLREEVVRQQIEARRRRLRYLHDRERTSAHGKVAIIADDGVATGLTMIAALSEIKEQHPAKIVIAVPVIPSEIADLLQELGAEIEALYIPAVYLGAVSAYYTEFGQVNDSEVVNLLKTASKAGNSDR